MSGEPKPDERAERRLALQFAAIAVDLHSAVTRDEALGRFVRAAVEVIDECDAASITVAENGGRPRTSAATGAVAERADELQYAVGEGPCLSALVEPVARLDDATWERWPALRASWQAVGAQSALSCRLAQINAQSPRAAINMYALEPNAFDGSAEELALILAHHGATAIGSSSNEVGDDGVLMRILESARTLPPDRLEGLTLDVAASCGARAARIFLIDHSLRRLMPFADRTVQPFEVDGTMGGRAYVTDEVVDARDGDHFLVWAPLRDGVDRLGVLQFELAEFNDARREMLRRIAAIVAAEIVSKDEYTDLFELARRDRPMTMAADLQRDLMPPQTFATDEVSVVSSIEPAYAAAGDTCDYAYNEGVLHAAVFDAIGHDFNASVVSSVAVAAYRHARRAGGDLPAIAAAIDAAIDDQFPEAMFSTGVLVTLHLGDGLLRWVNAGHPPPLLIRNGRVVGTMGGASVPPFGLGSSVGSSDRARVQELALQGGDRILLYTDGIVEARSLSGEDFGLERLEDFLQRAIASGSADAEIVRHLGHAVVDHHDGRLKDDATLLMISWHPNRG